MRSRSPRHYLPWRLCSRGAAGKREQRDVARPLDRFAQPPLMTRAHASHPARKNLPALLHELRQNVGALVVDEVHLLDAKLANFLLPEILPLAAPRSTGTSAWATRTAFTTRTTMPTATRPSVPAATRASVTTARSTMTAAFTARRAAWCWCLSLFLCHTRLPFQIALQFRLHRISPTIS
jgi:hypothetical protein